jgi:hypothetical protein
MTPRWINESYDLITFGEAWDHNSPFPPAILHQTQAHL